MEKTTTYRFNIRTGRPVAMMTMVKILGSRSLPGSTMRVWVLHRRSLVRATFKGMHVRLTSIWLHFHHFVTLYWCLKWWHIIQYNFSGQKFALNTSAASSNKYTKPKKLVFGTRRCSVTHTGRTHLLFWVIVHHWCVPPPKFCSCAAAASQWGFAAQLDLDVDGAVEIAAGYAGAIVVAGLKVRAAGARCLDYQFVNL